jgi:hypothetical protein
LASASMSSFLLRIRPELIQQGSQPGVAGTKRFIFGSAGLFRCCCRPPPRTPRTPRHNLRTNRRFRLVVLQHSLAIGDDLRLRGMRSAPPGGAMLTELSTSMEVGANRAGACFT